MSKLDSLLKDSKRIKESRETTQMFERELDQFKEDVNQAKEWLRLVNEKSQCDAENLLSFETTKDLLKQGSQLRIKLKELDNIETAVGKIDMWQQ